MPITETQFYDAMRALQAQLSKEINERANRIEEKLDNHADEDRAGFTAIGNRVLVIETQRENEKSQAVKRGSLVAMVVSAGSAVIIELIKRTWK